MDNKKILPINELYSCLQGEGKFSGVPHLLIRFSGCPLRCQFSTTDFCDTPYSSWSPEKGKITIKDIQILAEKYKQIRHVMITGGSPTSHPETLEYLCRFFRYSNYFITIETEGSAFVKTDAQFISLSPKLRSSRPRVGSIVPQSNKKVTSRDLILHEKNRSNFTSMKKLLTQHADYQVKFVVSNFENFDYEMEEIKFIERELEIPREKIYLMPAGATKKELDLRRDSVISLCISEGFNYTDRLHIVAFDNLRGV